MWKPHYEPVLLRSQIKGAKLLNQQIACFVEGRVASDELGMRVQMTSGGNIVEAVMFEGGFWVYDRFFFFSMNSLFIDQTMQMHKAKKWEEQQVELKKMLIYMERWGRGLHRMKWRLCGEKNKQNIFKEYYVI